MSEKLADSFGYSNIGTRMINEDSFSIFSEGKVLSAIVADGLGGHGGGKEASEIAVSILAKCGDKGQLPTEDDILQSLQRANQTILEHRINENHMKTTAVYLCIADNKAKWAHIGDSRLYHFWNGQLCDYTLDHSVSQMAVLLGTIDRSEIPKHSERSRVLRVLGHEEILPEIHSEILLEPGAHAFLLCTDGFWESVTEDEMMLDLYKVSSAKEWICCMRHRLMKRLGEDHDNHTAVAVMIEC